jgi:glycosyltransferase involved in cell wall biosynthesis
MDFRNISITAVVTTYNRFDLAKRAIESILIQTYEPDEVIIVDDASESNLEDWLMMIKSPVTRYIKNSSNLGLAASRNIGFREAKSEFIAYLDDDDVWMPKRLEEQVKLLGKIHKQEWSTIGSIQVGHQVIDSNEKVVGFGLPVNTGNLRDSIIEKGVHTFSSCFMFKKSALESVGGFDEKIGSGIDDDIWMSFAVHGYHNYGVMKSLVTVYKNERESMMRNTEKRISGLDRYFDKWEPVYKEWFGNKLGRTKAIKYYISAIGALGAEKLSHARFGDLILALSAIAKKTKWNMCLMMYAGYLISRTTLAILFPFLGRIKRELYHK